MAGVDLATGYINLVASAKGLGTSIVDQVSGAGETAGKAGGEKAGSGFTAGFGKFLAAGAVVGAVAGAGAAIVAIGETFEEVHKTIAVATGATGANLEEMEGIARTVASTVPVSFETAAKTAAGLSQRLGLTGADLTTVSEQFAAAGKQLGQAVDINTTTAALSAFGVKGAAVAPAMDQLFKVSQQTGVSMNDLATSVGANAPAMKNLGFSFNSTAAMAGTLNKAGLNSGTIMASMSKAMVKLAKTGEAPQAAFKRVTTSIGYLVKSGHTAAALSMAKGIFGVKGAAQFVGALQSGKLSLAALTSTAKLTGDGILKTAATSQTLGDKFTLLKNKAMVALQPFATKVIDLLGKAMDSLGPIFTQAMNVIGPVIDILANAVEALLPVFQSLVKAIMPVISSLMGPLAAALKSIVAAIAPVIQIIIGVLVPVIKALLPVVTIAFGLITGAIKAAAQIITGIIAVFTGILTGNWSKVWNGIKAIVSGVWSAIKNEIRAVLAVIGVIMSAAWNLIKVPVTAAWNLIKGIILGAWNAIRGAVVGALGVIGRAISAAWNAIKSVATTIWNGIKGVITGVWTTIKSAVSGAVNGVKDVIGGVWNGIKAVATTAWGLIKAAVINPLQAAWDWVKNVFSKIGATISGIWTGIVTTAGKILGGVGKAVGTAFGAVADVVKGAINGAIDLINNIAIGGLNSMIDLANKIPYVNISHIPNIPHLAAGGVVMPRPGGALVQVAEAGQPEIVAPQKMLAGMIHAAINGPGARGQGPLIGTVIQQPGQSPWQLAADLDRRMAFMGGR